MSGDEIRRIRERLDLTQGQAAALLGVHSVTWCRWERGALAPTPYQSALLEGGAATRTRRGTRA